jgi:transcriptional regulator GlxA family with amidase domain
LLDAAGPISTFEIAARFANTAPAIKTLAVTPGPVRSSSGVEMLARDLRSSSAITTLIVAGGEGVNTAAACPKTLAFVRAMAKRGIRIASVCSGAFILAEAGVLDGRCATTHWQRTRQFVTAYPRVKLEADRIYTRDGNIWTSAGITAGIDLSLAMVADDYGDEIAQRTAKQLVHQPSSCPPSTAIVCPVIHRACEDARKSATSAISSGVPRRPNGIRPSTCA